MTPYIIIATMNKHVGDKLDTIVMGHALKTNLEDARHWVDIFAEICKCETLKYGYEDARLISATGMIKDGWVDFDIWKEDDIEL